MAIDGGSSKASFVLGANDARLMDKNKNIFQVEKGKNQSYFKVELDISGVDGSENGRAKLNFYRAGYTDKDIANKPVKTFEIKTEYINTNNKNKKHHFEITGILGQLSVQLDGNISIVAENENQNTGNPYGLPGQKGMAFITLNPLGTGHDYITPD